MLLKSDTKKNGILFLSVFLFCDILAGTIYTAAAPQIRIESNLFDHGLKPNTRAVERWGPYKNITITNSLGFRDSEIRTIKLKKKTYRILLAGDSFTEGVGVDYEQTFAGILYRKFQKEGVEVLNAAVASYYPKIYLDKIRYLAEHGLEIDETVIFLDISDIPDEVDALTFSAKSLHTPKIEIRNFLEAHSLFFRVFFTAKYKYFVWPKIKTWLLEHNRKRALWTQDSEMFQEYGAPGLKLAGEHLGELARYLKSKKIKMTLAVYPWPYQIKDGRLDSPQVTYWQQWCAENKVPFINYFPYFLEAGSSSETIQKYYIAGDVHWNPAGHEYVADIFLKERSRLAETSFESTSGAIESKTVKTGN